MKESLAKKTVRDLRDAIEAALNPKLSDSGMASGAVTAWNVAMELDHPLTPRLRQAQEEAFLVCRAPKNTRTWRDYRRQAEKSLRAALAELQEVPAHA